VENSHLKSFNTVLVLAPHTDDGELGCGGTLHRLVRLGKKVVYVAFSSCEESVPQGFSRDIMKQEVKAATSKLGIDVENVILLDYGVRHFPTHRQELLEDLIKLKNELDPDLVFCPSSFDVHQDHSTINAEAKRAFKNTTLLGYEFIWNNFDFKVDCFIELSEENLQGKIAAMAEYRSQHHRQYATEKTIRSMAHFRGVQVGAEYAEAFEVIRWIIRM
jgi:LmbE family N-acetylglucosaminyl deacetylase